MQSRFRPRLTYANVVATIALVIALGVGGPALAEPVANGAASAVLTAKKILRLEKGAKKAVRIAKRAESRSKHAVESLNGLAAEVGPKGEKGEKGEKGDPGPAVGPAGGALTGSYPNPLLAPGSVGAAQLIPGSVGAGAIAPATITADQVADDGLGGDQIDESTLAGFDVSSAGSGFSLPTGGGAGGGLGNGLSIFSKCTGGVAEVGFEVEVDNNADSARTVYASATTDGEPAQLSRTVIPSGDQDAVVVDISDSFVVDRLHLVTIFSLSPEHRTHSIFVRTQASTGNDCIGEQFRTTPSQ